MGYNLTFVCHEHKKYHTSMRGEEGIDFQAMMREKECPGPCFKQGKIVVYDDQHEPPEVMREYAEVWPNWDIRPGERLKRGEPIYA